MHDANENDSYHIHAHVTFVFTEIHMIKEMLAFIIITTTFESEQY